MREFVNSGENTYKIGRSSKSFPNRIRSYPKNSKLYLCLRTSNNVIVESNLKKIFRDKFIKRSDYGSEYFQGDIGTMIKIMSDSIVNKLVRFIMK